METVLSGEELLGDHKSLVLRKVERDAGGWIRSAASPAALAAQRVETLLFLGRPLPAISRHH